MVNNKGFIRTLEAVIAIVIILGLIIYLAPEKKLEVSIPSNVKEAREYIFNEVLINESLRSYFKDYNGNCKSQLKLKEFLDRNVPAGYEYECEICETTGCANLDEVQRMKNVYTGAVYLGVEDKTFRLFLYEK